MTHRVALGLLIVCLAGWQASVGIRSVTAQAPPPVVYVVPIEGMIDLGLPPFLSRTLREAEQAEAAAVLVEINTFGGQMDAAVALRDALLDSPVRTIAFVNQRAISAGALIALACDTIVMVKGGTIGAAAPVVAGAGEAQPAGEKTVSYVRKEFRATAEARDRPGEIAEAMVDAEVAIAEVTESGRLLTLTTTEALALGIADATAPTVDEALEAADVTGAELRRVEQTWAETVVRFLTHPIVSSLLMSVGFLGLIVELRTPGFAVPGTVGLLALSLFFWGHWIVQLAGWEELLLVSLGVLLLALEIFVLPGITVAGVLGVLALVAGLGLSLIGAGATVPVMLGALGRVALAVLVGAAGALAIIRLMPRLPLGRRLILDTDMEASRGYVSPPEGDRQWLGQTGTAVSPLRPAGIAHINGVRVDVVSEGDFIETGASVIVSRVDGNRIVVRRLAAHQESQP